MCRFKEDIITILVIYLLGIKIPNSKQHSMPYVVDRKIPGKTGEVIHALI